MPGIWHLVQVSVASADFFSKYWAIKWYNGRHITFNFQKWQAKDKLRKCMERWTSQKPWYEQLITAVHHVHSRLHLFVCVFWFLIRRSGSFRRKEKFTNKTGYDRASSDRNGFRSPESDVFWRIKESSWFVDCCRSPIHLKKVFRIQQPYRTSHHTFR